MGNKIRNYEIAEAAWNGFMGGGMAVAGGMLCTKAFNYGAELVKNPEIINNYAGLGANGACTVLAALAVRLCLKSGFENSVKTTLASAVTVVSLSGGAITHNLVLGDGDFADVIRVSAIEQNLNSDGKTSSENSSPIHTTFTP